MFSNLKTYVINLDRSPERLVTIQKSLQNTQLNWERVSGVDGLDLSTFNPYEVDVHRYERLHGKRLIATEVGCFLSHVKALKLFLTTQEQFEFVLVLEDDAQPHEQFSEVIQALLLKHDCWDYVKLSNFHSGSPLIKENLFASYKLAIPFARHCNTAATLYNRKAAERLVKTLLPMTLPFDWSLERPWLFDLKMRIVTPSPCAASNGSPTTISSKDKNRKFAWYRRINAYWFRLHTEIRRGLWACSQTLKTHKKIKIITTSWRY